MSEVAKGNYVSEWFGYRLYPSACRASDAQEAWRTQKCVFLSNATGEDRACIKSANSKGICTISTLTEAGRRDWLVCPYRALDSRLLNEAVRRLFGLSESVDPVVLPAIRFGDPNERIKMLELLALGHPCFLYFDQKLGGEVSLSKTSRSPELSIDVTIIEVLLEDGELSIRRFGALEIQTMDFHGSYRHATKNLVDALRLHGPSFPEYLDKNQEWASDRIEGPNIANVFKRTFYQMAFKFQLGKSRACAGCVLALPKAVWESWAPHLGGPTLVGDTTKRLAGTESNLPSPPIAWIFSFELETDSSGSADRIVFDSIIETSAEALAYLALEVAPVNALEAASSDTGISGTIRRRLTSIWPDLAGALNLDVGVIED